MSPLLAAFLLAAISPPPTPGFVDLQALCPSIRIELRYATARNGAGRRLYPPDARCLVRLSVAERLVRVQRRLRKQGYGLVVWDAYRPPSAQRALWRAVPNGRFVMPPHKGSKHSRGAAVDVTLADRAGRLLPMPTDFDEFTPRASARYSGGSRERRANRDRLRAAMRAEGFQQDSREWWHFQAPDWRRFALAEVPIARPRAVIAASRR